MEFKIERVVDAQTTGNCYILIEDGSALIIDPNQFEQIEEVLKKNQATPEMVLLTHEHGDHISGLNALREHYRFQTIASLPCSQRIQKIRITCWDPSRRYGQPNRRSRDSWWRRSP